MIKSDSNYFFSVLMLVLAGIIWGLSFTSVKWALVDFTTTQLLFWRLFLAFIIGEGLLYLFYKQIWQKSHSDIFRSFKPGLFLGLSLLLQIKGLEYTSATNSGFITSLYVIIIPFVSILFFKAQIKISHFIFAIFAFVGTALLLDHPQILSINQSLNIGDLLTLGCAVAAAFQIIFIGQTAKQAANAFRYNNYQTFWCLITVIPFFIFDLSINGISFWPENMKPLSYLGLGLLIVFVSIIAFYLQVRAQRKLSTTTASMLCLLEAPFAFIFAALLIGERIQGLQILGATIILLSSILSVFVDRPQH